MHCSILKTLENGIDNNRGESYNNRAIFILFLAEDLSPEFRSITINVEIIALGKRDRDLTPSPYAR